MKHATLRVRMEEPDYSALLELDFVWAHSVYGTTHKMLPKDAPEPLSKFVMLTHFSGFSV